MREYSIQQSVTVYSGRICFFWRNIPEGTKRTHLKCSRIQMDTVGVKNRSKFLQTLHHVSPLPPSRPCGHWCEAGWRPIISLCLFRQSCLKLWCVTRAELYSEANFWPQIKGFSPMSPFAKKRIKAVQKDTFSMHVFSFLWEARAKNALFKVIYLSSAWLALYHYLLLMGRRWASFLKICHLLLCSIMPSIIAEFLIQSPQNEPGKGCFSLVLLRWLIEHMV